MRSHPISQYLIRFDADEISAPPPTFQFIAEPAVDHAEVEAAAREAGYAEGWDAGLAEARTEAETARSAERAAFDEELASQRAKWVGEEAERLTHALAAGFDGLTADIAHCVDQILRPFVLSAARAKALIDLGESFMRLGEDAPLMRISGPADLLDALRVAGTLPAGHLELTTDTSADVTIVAQPTLIETRLGAWVKRLDSLGEQTARV